jgi:uncharacterized protein DUF6812
MSELYTHYIEIYTASLVISGAYDLSIYRRVSDAINGEQRQYIPLRDGTIAPLERAQQVQRVPYLLVARDEVLLVTTIAEAPPPDGYPRDEQVRGVAAITAMFFTPAFVVRATFHKRPDLTLPETLERITDEFVPLRNIQVFPLLAAFPPLNRDFAALARARIVALYQLAEVPRAGTSEPESERAEPAPVEAPIEPPAQEAAPGE